MNEGNRLYKNLYSGGYAAYGVLLLFAIIFYRERTIFLDAAFHLFHILSTGNFAFQVHRYGAAFTQAFPLLASKLSLSLSTVMLVYSAGVMLYYIVCYWLCGSVLKNYRMALALLFTQVLLLTHAFYWIQAELQQGLAFMMVVFAWLEKQELKKMNAMNIVVSFALVTLVNFFHPLLIVPLVFAFIFFLVNGTTADKRIMIWSGVYCIILYFVKSRLLSNHYDEQQMKGLDNFAGYFPNYLNLPSNKVFLARCLNTFYWAPVIASIVAVTYIYKRKWPQLLLFLVFFIGFILLVNVSYPHATEVWFYIENLYLPLAVILAFPLVFHVLPVINRKLAMGITVLIIFTGLARIYSAHHIRTARLNWERRYLEKNIDKKLLVYNREVPMDTLLMTWGTPYEFWLLSTTEYGKTASIVIDEHADQLLWCKWENKEFITILEKTPYEKLPSRYFKMQDTVTHYDVTGEYEQ